MYQGKHGLGDSGKKRVVRRHKNKSILLLLPVLVLILAVIGGTAAYLLSQTSPVKNDFTLSHVSCEVTESFDGFRKTDVNVTNTGDTEAFLRVKLVSYRVNTQGQRIGGQAAIPAFTPGSGWTAYGGFYYYTAPVAPGASPADPLIDSMDLAIYYDDADGGRQVIEIMAEAIQSTPDQAVGSAWGVRISNGTVSAYQ